MFEREILQLLHDLNIENLNIKNKTGFSDFFKSILKSSHFFIKLGYHLLFLILYINIIFLKIFFLLEDKKLIKYTEDFDWNINLNKKKTNYNFEILKMNNYIKQNSKLLENYDYFSLDTKILKFNKKENSLNLDPRILLILLFILVSIICLIFQSLISKFKFKV